MVCRCLSLCIFDYLGDLGLSWGHCLGHLRVIFCNSLDENCVFVDAPTNSIKQFVFRQAKQRYKKPQLSSTLPFGGPNLLDFVTFIMFLDKELKIIKDQQNLNFDIEVDGGINFDNSKLVIDAGANILVSGTTIFKSNQGNMKKNIDILKSG